ncbi:MAG: tetratricopeptide repeat protein, partial [Bacteroidota bacterium]
QALEVDPKSSLALYEMALLFYNQTFYEEAIGYAEQALKYDKSSQKQALLLKGSALDNLGQSKEAIKVYKKAVKRYNNDYLVHYNTGLTYWRAGEAERAEDHLHEAIFLKPEHLNSHYLIWYIQQDQKKTVESLLSGLYYLSLDAESQRAGEILDGLLSTYNEPMDRGNGNVIGTKGKEWEEDIWAEVRLLLPLLSVQKAEREKASGAKMSPAESYLFYTKGFLEGLPRASQWDGTIWSEVYLPFFQRLQYHRLIEPFAYYAAMAKPDWSRAWLESHAKEMEGFYARMVEAQTEQRK